MNITMGTGSSAHFFGGICSKMAKELLLESIILNIRKNNIPRNILAGGAQEFGLGKSIISEL